MKSIGNIFVTYRDCFFSKKKVMIFKNKNDCIFENIFYRTKMVKTKPKEVKNAENKMKVEIKIKRKEREKKEVD